MSLNLRELLTILSPDNNSNIIEMINTIMQNPKSNILLEMRFSSFDDFRHVYARIVSFIKEISPNIAEQVEKNEALILAYIKNKMDTMLC